MPSSEDTRYIQQCMLLANQAAQLGEVPVGAIVVHQNTVIARRHNQKERELCSTAHAEILAIQEASRKLGRWRLSGCTLYVSLEPCSMCAGALVQSRIDRLVFGAFDPKAGAAGSLMNLCQDERLNHRMEVEGGVEASACGALLSEFFRARRQKKKAQKPSS